MEEVSAFQAYHGNKPTLKKKKSKKQKKLSYDKELIDGELKALKSVMKKKTSKVNGEVPCSNQSIKPKSEKKRRKSLSQENSQKPKKQKTDDEKSVQQKKANQVSPIGNGHEKGVQSIKKKKKSTKHLSSLETKNSYKVATADVSANREDPDSGSVESGRKCFEWMISPCKADEFFSETFERRPLHIKRGKPDYYGHVFSTQVFDNILRSEEILFGKNLDVTSFTNGQRETHNPNGKAYGPVVWDFYNSGCSMRLLNPQTFHDPVWKICATLQEFMGNMVGANVYLTPPGTQGFAPHYDDVEVFILQLEGKKRWRLYEPRTTSEVLPRFSSVNFSQDEIGEPCKDFVLEAGDMVYLPRGTIHQGICLKDAHSLHITISCHQLNTFGDLLLKLMPAALETAIEEDVDFRAGLPHDYLSYMGVANSESSSSKRAEFVDKVKKLVDKLFNFASVDLAADQLAKRFMHDSLPPYLTESEKERCVVSGGEKWDTKTLSVSKKVELCPETEVRLMRANCLRIVTEEDNAIRIYYNVENSREYHEREAQFIEIEPEQTEIVEKLIANYPNYISLEDLGADDLDVIQILWESKLLLTKEPLN